MTAGSSAMELCNLHKGIGGVLTCQVGLLVSPISMASNPAPAQLETVRNFVNTYDAEDGSDRIATPQQLQEWLLERDLLEAGHRVTAVEHERAIAVRTALHQTLLSHHGEPLAPEAPDVLEDASCRARLGLRFSAKGCAILEPKADGV